MHSTSHLGAEILEGNSINFTCAVLCAAPSTSWVLINIEQPSNQALQAMAAVVSRHICRLYTVGIANQTVRSEHTENSRDNSSSITFK